jgi:hypothetical protein
MFGSLDSALQRRRVAIEGGEEEKEEETGDMSKGA